jgi:2-polyprenyl-6-methoxyphenol hydroxylase-like FAD-dependent oxidoreductase
LGKDVDNQRVIVVGGGIGGLAVANALRGVGIPVTVLEQATELAEIGAAIGVQTNAVHALRTMGLADALVRRGVAIEHYEYHSWHGRRLVRWSQGDIGRRLGEPTVVVHRADLQQTLLQGLGDSGILQLGARCVGYDEDEHGVTVHLADQTVLRGALLIGADGIRSAVRRQLVGEQPPRFSGWVAYRAVTRFDHEEFPVGLARQTLGSGRSFGMWHLSEGRVYWVATKKERLGSDVPPGERKRHVVNAFNSAHAPIAELVERTDEEVILRNEVYDRKPITGWSSARTTLLGDAAHPTTPVTGQGGGQAVIDASVLAAELAKLDDLSDRGRVRAALAAYESRRAPVTSSITNEAWRIAAMHHVENPLAVLARDLSLQLTPTRTWHKRMEQRLAF